MAARIRLLQRSAVLISGGAVYSVIPTRIAYAEAPTSKDELPKKKSIYSHPVLNTTPKPAIITDPLTNSPPSIPEASIPTPTDRLAAQIKQARLALHTLTVTAEDKFNSALTWTFKQETSFANTIASLAPAPATGEQLLPGLIYVLVATMAGSIVSRNRNILVRATFPAIVGITAGWMLIPVTMRNTADLLWQYEKKVPGLPDAHLTVRGAVIEAYQAVKERTKVAVDYADGKVIEARKKVEEVVSEGR